MYRVGKANRMTTHRKITAQKQNSSTIDEVLETHWSPASYHGMVSNAEAPTAVPLYSFDLIHNKKTLI